MSGFTVLDTETTGFSNKDRIIEAAFVFVSEAGEFQGQWHTLVNPDRDSGRVDIHGIRSRYLVNAPKFADLAPHIVQSLQGRTLVAHNATFDARMLQNELNWAGYDLEIRPPALCTMKWAKAVLGEGKLGTICALTGITLDDAHQALSDTRATAELLAYLLARFPGTYDDIIAGCAAFDWPTLPDFFNDAVLLHRPTGTGYPEIQHRETITQDAFTHVLQPSTFPQGALDAAF